MPTSSPVAISTKMPTSSPVAISTKMPTRAISTKMPTRAVSTKMPSSSPVAISTLKILMLQPSGRNGGEGFKTERLMKEPEMTDTSPNQ